jgi:hypothetical protein
MKKKQILQGGHVQPKHAKKQTETTLGLSKAKLTGSKGSLLN